MRKMVPCIFHEHACIPLWPQYQHKKANGYFVKVDTQESWLKDLVAACRSTKTIPSGQNARDRKTKKQSSEDHVLVRQHIKGQYSVVMKTLCDEIRSEFRRVLWKARDSHEKIYDTPFPEVLHIKMLGSSSAINSTPTPITTYVVCISRSTGCMLGVLTTDLGVVGLHIKL